MKRGLKWFLIILSILILILLIIYFYPKSYDKFHLIGNPPYGPFCENYYSHCNCFGSYIVLASLPPKYRCSGFELCKDVNYTKC